MKESKQFFTGSYKIFLAVLLLGLGTGLGAIILHYFLDLVQLLVFERESVSVGELRHSIGTSRRVLSLMGIGCVAAIGWYLLQRKSSLISIKKQFQGGDEAAEYPSLRKQGWHILLQILSVGAGSPVGKEVAPRELGSLLAGRLARRFSLREEERRLLIACGAGAGLAAIYQVPLASIFFVVESFSIKRNLRNLAILGASIFTASSVAHMAISDAALYQTDSLSLTLPFVILSLVLPFLLLPFLFLYHYWIQVAGRYRIKDRRILVSLPLVLALVAICSISYPEILGNGSFLAQSIFNGESPQRILILAGFKLAFVGLTLMAGAYGGTLTPSFALGIATASLLAIPFQWVFPMLALEIFLLLGATTFLAVMLKAPLTAASLVLAFTGQDWPVFFPLLLSAFLAYQSFYYLSAIFQKGKLAKNRE